MRTSKRTSVIYRRLCDTPGKIRRPRCDCHRTLIRYDERKGLRGRFEIVPDRFERILFRLFFFFLLGEASKRRR